MLISSTAPSILSKAIANNPQNIQLHLIILLSSSQLGHISLIMGPFRYARFFIFNEEEDDMREPLSESRINSINAAPAWHLEMRRLIN